MAHVDIKYIWWIDDKEAWASLTWSSTLLKSSKDVLWWNSIIIDFWMHQWSKNADLLNKEISKELLNADFLVITHAHMDHIWRVPQLIKAWFKWKIIMTSVTKDLALLMWQDYITLTQKQQEELIEWNKKKWQKLREYLIFVNYYSQLSNSKINGKEKDKIKKKLNNIAWNINLENIYILSNKKLEEFTKQDKTIKSKWWSLIKFHNFINLYKKLDDSDLIQSEIIKIKKELEDIARDIHLESFFSFIKIILEKYKIENSSDIEEYLNKNIPELLYDVNDVYETLEHIETLEYWEEMSLDSRIVITKKDSEVIERLAQIIEEWYNKKIYVLPWLKQVIIDKLKNKYNEVVEYNKENKRIREELYKSYKIVKKYNKNPNLINLEELWDFDSIEDFILYHREFLKEFDILFTSDIENLKELIKPLPYTKKQLSKIISRLEPILEKENEKIVESLKIRFYKAGHIEWSAMASISYITKEVKSKVNWLLRRVDSFDWHKEIKKSHKNLLFSWDLWKVTQPNLSWKPDIPDLKYDYVQLESTYSDRNHPDKIREFERLIDILNRPWKKLIAAFSLERTQEVLVELLENKKNNLWNIDKIKKLYNNKSKLKKQYNKLKSRNNLWEEDLQQKNKLFSQISSIEEDIEELSKWVFNWFIIQDSPLASKITKVFINHFPELYKILDPLIQKSVFWKEQIRELQFGEYKKLYEWKRAWDNDIIISSGWMLQWGAIINHIKNIISDERATLILTWYVAEWTLWRELLDIEKQLLKASGWAKKISIDWEEYDVKCKIESIWWYSSHMWKNDLIDFSWKQLNYSKNAKLALTHWDENREKLKEVIECINKKVDILVPKLWEKIKIIL